MAQVTVYPNASPPYCDPPSVVANGANATTVFQIDPHASAWQWGTPAVYVWAGPGLFSGGANPGGNGKGNVNVQSRNNSGEQGKFKYSATLTNPSTGVTLVIDPEIVNTLDAGV